MSLQDEIESYNKSIISPDGEIETWDQVIFPEVIRKREIELIFDVVKQIRPKRILDYGCGAGWLTKILSHDNGIIGIDVSIHLIESAKRLSTKQSEFLVGDCMNLPFQDGTFDLVVGMGVLHHLQAEQGLAECYRVTSPRGTLLLMEPNKLNPLAAFGRKIAPPETYTKGEKPFYPWELRKALVRTGWAASFTYKFPFSWSLAYLLKKVGLGDKQGFRIICPLIEGSEKLFEKMPYLNHLCWQINVVAQKAAV